MFLFYKQKSAYDMRISDWSSDVCSSDLVDAYPRDIPMASLQPRRKPGEAISSYRPALPMAGDCVVAPLLAMTNGTMDGARIIADQVRGDERSEEHTSELQSLMRISYAVFCLKTKTNKINSTNTSFNITHNSD